MLSYAHWGEVRNAINEEDLLGAFKQRAREEKKVDKAEKDKKAAKNRIGPRLDLANRPQNFFRGIAERDAALERRREQGFQDTPADLLGASPAARNPRQLETSEGGGDSARGALCGARTLLDAKTRLYTRFGPAFKEIDW